MVNEKKGAAYRQVVVVFVVLAVLTVIEYAVGLVWPALAPLMIIALLKAALIVHFFMHLYRLWREEEH